MGIDVEGEARKVTNAMDEVSAVIWRTSPGDGLNKARDIIVTAMKRVTARELRELLKPQVSTHNGWVALVRARADALDGGGA